MTCAKGECLTVDLEHELIKAQVELSDPIHVKRDVARSFLDLFTDDDLTLDRMALLLRGLPSREGA